MRQQSQDVRFLQRDSKCEVVPAYATEAGSGGIQFHLFLPSVLNGGER
jgi:hypothetical protein